MIFCVYIKNEKSVETNNKITLIKVGDFLIEKICNFLTSKIQKEMPEVDEERAEVINYGLQLVIGEIPKIFIIFILAYILRSI